MTSERICCVEGCDKPIKTRERCNAHYLAAWRRGEITRVQAVRGAGRIFIRQALLMETGECIIWPFGRSHDGYPVINMDGVSMHGHRYVCAQAHGHPPDGMLALHSCHTPACVNKRHLRWGTPMDNINDRKSSPRRPVGIRGPSARLTVQQVREMRAIYPRQSMQELGDHYGVTRATVHRIIHRRSWSNI